MPKIKLRLLGKLNLDNGAGGTLKGKYIASITASELAQYLRYRKIGKKHPYKIDDDSLIQVDEKFQRGFTDEGGLRQEEKKVKEIAQSLLGVAKSTPSVFLGTLVWNVRSEGSNHLKVLKELEEGEPPRLTLEINAKSIYLTDSAHRHLGICEAYKQYRKDEEKFRSFNEDFEFPVEIYNLDREGEASLFDELNSKQKKISAAKAQQVDMTSPIGRLKDLIQETDLGRRRLFHQNIEVNSNQNDRHTLMTMSAFTASVREMFGNELVKQSDDDSDLRAELADYYCDFFYKLSDTIEITCNIRDKPTDLYPFQNLYLQYIYPIENEEEADEDSDKQSIFEKKLASARQKAHDLNKQIREEDKIISNPFVKALSHLGGKIRRMPGWESVIEVLQTRLIASHNGRYFQVGNERLTEKRASGHSIASVKEDGRLNVQVQTHIINEIKQLLEEELRLSQKVECWVERGGEGKSVFLHEVDLKYTEKVSSTRHTFIDLYFQFEVGANEEVDVSSILVKVDPDVPDEKWRQAEKKGKKRLIADTVTRIKGKEHELYGDSIATYEVKINLDLPEYNGSHSGAFPVRLTFSHPDLSGKEVESDYVIYCQAD